MYKLTTASTKRLLLATLFLLVVVILPATALLAQRAAALTGSDFHAGHIIDDSIFTYANSMSVQNIQNFLSSKVPTCDTNHTGFTGGTGTVYNPPFVCLKSFYENPNSTYSVGFSYKDTTGAIQTGSRTYYNNNAYKVTALCPVYGGYSGTPTCGSGNYQKGLDHLIPTLQTTGLGTPSGAESAAQIIYNAAQQYNINPQVLIVLLQKEQGLVTDTWPASYEYEEATGYGCPDTAPCSSNYAGFSNQVTTAAWQFRQYLTNPNNYNYVVGNNSILYSPAAGCTSSTVNIQNQATAALYDYTPYQPNPAALSNVTDSSAGGDDGGACGSYGNRNFWWYFNEWFGASLTSAYYWQPAGQAAYTDSTMSTPVDLSHVVVGQRIYLSVTVTNEGTATWQRGSVDLATSNPQDRTSSIYDSSWRASNRPATLDQASVAPGQTGTFSFWVTASKTGNYKEYFNLVAEGITWMNDMGLYFGFNVSPKIYSWQPVSQYAYTDQTKSTPINLNSMAPGISAYNTVTIKNTGNVTWYRGQLNLGTADPQNRSSSFARAWVKYNRPATMNEASVAPGQTATFEFWTIAPQTPGTYKEYFEPVDDGYTWLPDLGLYFQYKVNAPSYRWQPVSQAAYTDSTMSTPADLNNISPGGRYYMTVTVRNSGNQIWQQGIVNLGTSQPNDRHSAFYDITWFGPNRPATIANTWVDPNQTTTFGFWVHAPNAAGTYKEYFNLVAENITWMNDMGLYFQYNVH